MAEIDVLASKLFEEAKRFLERAKESESRLEDSEAFLHAALNLSFCSLEAHINSIADDFLTREDLSPNEQALLRERRLDLRDGKFVVTEHLQIYRLEDRILFLCNRFSGDPQVKVSEAYWSQFKEALHLRNALTHPKESFLIDFASVQRSLHAILDLLDAVYRSCYRKGYPAVSRGLDSSLTF